MNTNLISQRYMRWPATLLATFALAVGLSASIAEAASGSSTPTGQAAGPPAQPPGMKKWTDCLKKHGVALTLPSGRRPGAGAPRPGQAPARQTPRQRRAFAACKQYQPKLPGRR